MNIDPIKPYLPLVYGGVLLAVVGVFMYQRHTINGLREDAVLYDAAVKSYASAQTTNLENITDLQGRLDALVLSRKRDAEASAQAVADAEAEEAAIRDRLATTTEELKNVYSHTPSARAWAATGVDAAVADRLPKHPRSR